VMEQHGGKLPPDATLRPDNEPTTTKPPLPGAKPKPRRKSERFAVLNAFVDFGISTAKLTPAEALVWLVLFRDTKAATGTARTAQTDVAKRTGLDVRTVRRAVASLEAKRMLVTVRRGRLNAGPSAYRLHPTGTT
jgi:hypothetical protein